VLTGGETTVVGGIELPFIVIALRVVVIAGAHAVEELEGLLRIFLGCLLELHRGFVAPLLHRLGACQAEPAAEAIHQALVVLAQEHFTERD
jgi:hypothetical protein